MNIGTAVVTTTAANDYKFGASELNTNSCFTDNDWNKLGIYVAGAIAGLPPISITSGFGGSYATCIDYVVDDYVISGTQTLD
jgi:hypothetical protein